MVTMKGKNNLLNLISQIFDIIIPKNLQNNEFKQNNKYYAANRII